MTEDPRAAFARRGFRQTLDDAGVEWLRAKTAATATELNEYHALKKLAASEGLHEVARWYEHELIRPAERMSKAWAIAKRVLAGQAGPLPSYPLELLPELSRVDRLLDARP